MHHRDHHARGRHFAFALTDLAVTLLLLAVLVAVVLPVLAVRSREAANKVRCVGYLRVIGNALAVYAGTNQGNFPRTRYDPADPTPTEYTGVRVPGPFAPNGPGPNDVTSGLFLLVRMRVVPIEYFICPSSGDAVAWDFEGNSPAFFSNFPGRPHLSYGYQNPYPSAAGLAAGFKFDNTLGSDFAVAADMSPGGAALATTTASAAATAANSRNHNGEGQNVLYADGHVEWHVGPYCGAARPLAAAPRDNIYTAGVIPGWNYAPPGGMTVRGGPEDPFDSVLLPTADDGPQPPPATLQLSAVLTSGRFWIGVTAVGGVAGIGLVTWLLLRRGARIRQIHQTHRIQHGTMPARGEEVPAPH